MCIFLIQKKGMKIFDAFHEYWASVIKKLWCVFRMYKKNCLSNKACM